MNTNKLKGTMTRYNRLRIFLITLMCVVSLAPLIMITFTSYYEYEEVFTSEMTHQVNRRISNIKQAIEFFISERLAATIFLINDKSSKELSNKRKLSKLLSHMKESFGGFIDLGLIDSKGNHLSYAGPYKLEGKNYKDQQWFQEVSLEGTHVSDVFMGFRKFPHFVIAVKHELENGDFYILRATLNTVLLNKKIHFLEFGAESDVFLINREGILQTSSRFYGKILEKYMLPVPPFSQRTIVKNEYDAEGVLYIFGYAYIEKSPFILIVTKRSEDFLAGLLGVRNHHFWFLMISILIITIVIFRSTFYMVNRIKVADQKQAKVFQDMGYTSKMVSIGRLGAGVAHEINNPLAIINEKAGLLKDFAIMKSDFNYKDDVLSIVDSILNSVERCSAITHRLLSFTKRMDIDTEVIDLELLLREVKSFLDTEASSRNILVNFHIDKNLSSIESDRGQLQQVFLNIITNAYYAVEENGKIDICADQKDNQQVEITVTDNGVGISEEHLKNIFDPFFTTKGKFGTGLGLSISYSIVQKLGGRIDVTSKLGEGTTFSVVLPIKSNNT